MFELICPMCEGEAYFYPDYSKVVPCFVCLGWGTVSPLIFVDYLMYRENCVRYIEEAG
jgi:hypothetical protein